MRRALLLLAGTALVLGAPPAATATAAGPPEGLDGRGWELVSPAAKNGGEVGAPGGVFGGGVFEAAAGGGAITYSSEASFGEAAGAAPGSQYLARRGSDGWTSENVTAPLLSGSFRGGGEGVPYQLFSPDLGTGLLSNGGRCRGEGEECAVASPPPAGSEAPAGYRDYYLRDGAGGFTALLTRAAAPALTLPPERFELAFAGAAPDLRHVVLSTCAALTGDATEVAAGSGCEPAAANLYEWEAGRLRLLNLLPGEAQGAPGAALAAPTGAVSADGARVYWTQGGDLYLREALPGGGARTLWVDEAVGGGGAFEAAGEDGAVAFFVKGGHLYRYDAATQLATDLTPAGEVLGVLGAAADGSSAYYAGAAGVFRWRAGGGTTQVAASGTLPAAAPSDYPAATGTARVSADGGVLVFLSKAPLTGYDNTDRVSGQPDSEVFVYDAGAGTLTCASCKLFGVRPLGPSTIPGAVADGEGPGATRAYKPRVLSAGGRRLFFDSADALLAADTDGTPDVYEWEAQGEGSCQTAGGCLGLVSSGRVGSATFLDASADGGDAFFVTEASLVGGDTGGVDVYDARVGGGFPESPPAIPCEGDACQGPAPAPEDPVPGTATLVGPSNPPVAFAKPRPGKRHRARHRQHHGRRHGGGR